MKTKGKAKLFSTKYILHDVAKVTAALPGLLVYRPKILYQSPAARRRVWSGAILIGNHTGYWDPVYMMFGIWYRRHHFICAKEFFERRGKFFFKHFLCIGIDRENFGMDTFREITEHLKNGELVTMFPEGTIKDRLDTFKSGMVLMAMQGGVPIIPLYISPRRTPTRRLLLALGEPIDVLAQCGDRPMFSQIEGITKLLYDRELQLEKMCEDFFRKEGDQR